MTVAGAISRFADKKIEKIMTFLQYLLVELWCRSPELWQNTALNRKADMATRWEIYLKHFETSYLFITLLIIGRYMARDQNIL